MMLANMSVVLLHANMISETLSPNSLTCTSHAHEHVHAYIRTHEIGPLYIYIIYVADEIQFRYHMFFVQSREISTTHGN